MHRGWPVGESFDHCPPGWIRQSRKRCTQFIHNRMVVDYLAMSSVNFAIHDFCSLIPNVPSAGGKYPPKKDCRPPGEERPYITRVRKTAGRFSVWKNVR